MAWSTGAAVRYGAVLALTEEAVTGMDEAREGSHGPGIGTLRATERTRTVGERDRFWGVIRAPRRGNAPPHVTRTLHGQFRTEKRRDGISLP